LSDNPDLPRLYVVLEATEQARCSWCGTISPRTEWSRGIGGKVYCSNECRISGDGPAWILIVVFFIPIGLYPFLLFIPAAEIIIIMMTALVVLLLSYYTRETRKKASPKGSRRDEQLSEMALLQSRLQLVKCPMCNKNLNLSIVKEDGVFHCQYCDATGVLEIEIAGDESGN
jgi:uncharacterized Zn-finger protein